MFSGIFLDQIRCASDTGDNVELTFNVTRKCNIDCKFCYLQRLDEDLEKTDVFRIIEAASPDTITFTGGEPLLHPDITEMVQFASKKVQNVNVLTNGILLEGELMSALVATGAEIYVSYHSHNKRLASQMARAGESGVNINIQHLLTTYSLQELGRVLDDVQFARRVLFLYPTKTTDNDIEMYGPEEWECLLSSAINVANRRSIRTFYEPAFVKKSEGDVTICPSGSEVFIDSDGLNYPCCFLARKCPGSRSLKPIRVNPEDCYFLMQNTLPESSKYRRICPLLTVKHGEMKYNTPGRVTINHEL